MKHVIGADAITDYFFTTSEVASENLRRSGVSNERIHFVGNTMIDTLLANMGRMKPPSFWDDMNLQSKEYFVVTLHRPANVDKVDGFARLITEISNATRGMPVIFPLHPRTAKTLNEVADIPSNIHIVDPQAYLEFNYMVKYAKGVITDSGGITEEATVMGVPCLTLRDTTERPETVSIGTNELIGTDPSKIKPALDRLFDGRWKKGQIPALWDGKTGQRIAQILEEIL